MTAPPPPAPVEVHRGMVLTEEQTTIYTTGPAYGAAVDRLRAMVRGVARSMADDDDDLAEDLMQEAWIHLWELDPSRYAASDMPALRKALMRKMIDARRKEEAQAKMERRVSGEEVFY